MFSDCDPIEKPNHNQLLGIPLIDCIGSTEKDPYYRHIFEIVGVQHNKMNVSIRRLSQ